MTQRDENRFDSLRPCLTCLNVIMEPEIDPNVGLPLCLFNILAAANKLDGNVGSQFIKEQCGEALRFHQELCGPEGKAAFQAHCELEGENPFRIGIKTYHKYASTVSRPPPQSALSECKTVNDNDDVREARRREQERIAQENAEAHRREQERIAQEKAEAERREQIAREKAEAERLEKERIAKEKADAARLERERLRKKQLADAKAAAASQYTNEACENRIVKSTELLRERLEKNELDEEGPKYHPVEVDLPEAHNKTVIDILLNEEGNDAEECIVQLGETCSNTLNALLTKRIIIGRVRDGAIDEIKENAPDIDERAGMGAMLTVLESKDGQNDDDSITNAAKDCITLAVNSNVLEKKGASACKWFIHYSSFGHEYKAAFAKCIGIFCLMTVAINVPLADVLDSDTISDAKVLADERGYKSLDGLTLGQFTLLIGAPSILGNVETEMEMAMGVICRGFLGLLGDNFVDVWRQYGDKIILPDEDGVIRFSETAPDYFSDAVKGTARKTGVVLNLLAVFQSPIIALLHSGDVGNLDGKQLARALLRCPTSDLMAKTKLLKQGDLFFAETLQKAAEKFVRTHLAFLLKKSKGRAEIYLKYCIFLDLRRDIRAQLELLLKVLNRSDLELDILQH